MTVDEYLVGAPQHPGPCHTLLEILPDAEEAISYNIPTVKVEGKAINGYAYFKNHCSYFPHSGSVLAQVADELSEHKWSKGTLHFPPDRPLPEKLVRRLVEVRMELLGARDPAWRRQGGVRPCAPGVFGSPLRLAPLATSPSGGGNRSPARPACYRSPSGGGDMRPCGGGNLARTGLSTLHPLGAGADRAVCTTNLPARPTHWGSCPRPSRR